MLKCSFFHIPKVCQSHHLLKVCLLKRCRCSPQLELGHKTLPTPTPPIETAACFTHVCVCEGKSQCSSPLGMGTLLSLCGTKGSTQVLADLDCGIVYSSGVGFGHHCCQVCVNPGSQIMLEKVVRICPPPELPSSSSLSSPHLGPSRAPKEGERGRKRKSLPTTSVLLLL